jgi:hypothetical protein
MFKRLVKFFSPTNIGLSFPRQNPHGLKVLITLRFSLFTERAGGAALLKMMHIFTAQQTLYTFKVCCLFATTP